MIILLETDKIIEAVTKLLELLSRACRINAVNFRVLFNPSGLKSTGSFR